MCETMEDADTGSSLSGNFERHGGKQDASRVVIAAWSISLAITFGLVVYYMGNGIFALPSENPKQSGLQREQFLTEQVNDDGLGRGDKPQPDRDKDRGFLKEVVQSDPQVVPASGPLTQGHSVPRSQSANGSIPPHFDQLFSQQQLLIKQIDLKMSEFKLVHEKIGIATTLAKSMAVGRLRLRCGASDDDYTVLMFVPCGRFRMGLLPSERARLSNMRNATHFDFAEPAHTVALTIGFFIGEREVSVAQFEAFSRHRRGSRPPVLSPAVGNRPLSPNRPVTGVSWEESMAYCNWLGDQCGFPIRLPTEIEWEYAARGNMTIQESETLAARRQRQAILYEVNDSRLDRAWSGAVAMTSNAREWCYDEWNQNAYRDRIGNGINVLVEYPEMDPGLKGGGKFEPSRVTRGGCFSDSDDNFDPALRRPKIGTEADDTIGFRIVLPLYGFFL
jgi:formylglycine-generating enzyme required for sulfatase activity